VFKSREDAEQARVECNGQALDGHLLQFGNIKEWKIKKEKSGGFEDRLGKKMDSRLDDRLGKKVEDRLGKRLDDRLGKKLDDRLGKKIDDRLGKKSIQRKKKMGDSMDTDDAPPERVIKNYGDTEVAIHDGALI
jgi:hypothetical protein